MRALRPIMFECGPNHRPDVAGIRERYGLDVSTLIYAREPRLAHTNHHSGGGYAEVNDVRQLYLELNERQIPFNLALNGSPDYYRRVPLDHQECTYLEELQESGAQTGVRNAVTIADNALLSGQSGIRQRFPGLEVIGSCISTAFEPNLVAFRNERGVGFDDPLFLIKYYNYLYSIYDRVIPITQLITPAFLFALDLSRETLTGKTILFLNLGCGSPYLGRCVNHYRGIRDEVAPNFPTIPEQYLAKPEDQGGATESCNQAATTLQLMNRFDALHSLLEAGFHQFKVPARFSTAGTAFDFLCRFIRRQPPPERFPDRMKVRGYSNADIKLSFMEEYPVCVHQVLRDYVWPRYECASSAYEIHADLHAKAQELWQSLAGETARRAP